MDISASFWTQEETVLEIFYDALHYVHIFSNTVTLISSFRPIRYGDIKL